MFSDFSVSPEGWGSFMQQIFDLWYYDFERNEAPQIRFIENAFQMMVGLPSPECTFTETFGDYVVLEHNGDVYSCDYFVNQHTLLGNIHQKTIQEMLNSAQQHQFGVIKKHPLHGKTLDLSGYL